MSDEFWAVFAVDPGAEHKKHTESDRGTGWALLLGTATKVTLEASGLVQGGSAAFLAEVIRPGSAVQEGLEVATDVVCENFVLLKRWVKPEPLVTLGQLQMWAALNGRRFVAPMPGARAMVDHDDLRRIGMWPGGAGHADEAQAIRHGLSYLLRMRHGPTLRLIAPDQK